MFGGPLNGPASLYPMKIQLETEGYSPPRYGLALLQICIGLLFVIFCARFWYLQIHRGAEFAQLAQENRIRHERIFAPRGEIYDRNGVLLAENRVAFGLAVVREDTPDIPAALAQVSAWTGVQLERITSHYERERTKGRIFDPILMQADLSFGQVAPIEAELFRWPGLQVFTHSRRHYTQGPVFAHILGYVAEASEEELRNDKNLALGDVVGRQGLEFVLEPYLRGQKGLSRLEVDALRRPLSRTLVESPNSGQNVVLSLDTRLQVAIMEAMGDYSGCVVVMDPDTGKLIAMATKPSYDNNIFIGTLSRRDWDALQYDLRSPLQNRAIQNRYPPGSIWKLMMAGLILESGISPNETVHCSGEFTLGNQTFRCWRRGGHGRVDLGRSLIESCDVYYYTLGDRLGIDAIENFAKACGFGSRTGIDLPHENSALVPSRPWKLANRNERWQGGDTINVSIGQGYTLVTPMQIAVYISALINGGDLLKPQLMDNAEREVRAVIPLSTRHREMILDYMVKTVEAPGATARILRRADMRIGGKTGTAQAVRIRMEGERRLRADEMEFLERDHAWMATWGERNGRRVVVVTMLEHGGGGSSAAGPVTKAVYDILFPLAGGGAE